MCLTFLVLSTENHCLRFPLERKGDLYTTYLQILETTTTTTTTTTNNNNNKYIN